MLLSLFSDSPSKLALSNKQIFYPELMDIKLLSREHCSEVVHQGYYL